VARGSTGASRSTPGQQTGNSAGSGVPGGRQDAGRSGGETGSSGRLTAIVCGRRSKYLVVVFWILVVAALGSLAGKLPGAEKNDASALYATLAVVVALLLLTYRSPLLWLLPIMSAGVALTVAQAVVYLLTRHASLTVNGQGEGILVVLVIGASTDYALLLIARYREELHKHADRHQAMAVALRRACPAIIASALTVVAGMLCLLAAESNGISGLGPVAAIGIAVGLVAMITLLPAMLVVFGRWIFPRAWRWAGPGTAPGRTRSATPWPAAPRMWVRGG
jgi:RND superfamily putative drug exporter